jgi:RNA polymerase sigma-70 factor (ECF subfamily)
MSEQVWQEIIERLNSGDPDAVEQVLRAYEPYLRMANRRRLSGPLRAKLDSMDIVQSVWADLVTGFRASGWQFRDRAHLQAFLLRVAQNRLIDRRRRHHRALEREQPLTDAESPAAPVSTQPQPSELAQGRELWDQLVELCPPHHRELLRLKRQGLTLAEIAGRCGLHEGSVRRILYDLARRLASARDAERQAINP